MANDENIFVCCRRNDVEGLKKFIQSDTNININIKNDDGEAPLHHAARSNFKECLQLLLEAGADPNIKNNRGNTPLEFIRDENFKKETEEYIQELSTFNIKEPSC